MSLPLTLFSAKGLVAQEALTITFEQAQRLDGLGITRYGYPSMIMWVIKSADYLTKFYQNTDRRYDTERPQKGSQLDLTKPIETREEYRQRMAGEYGHLTPYLRYTLSGSVGAHCPLNNGLAKSEKGFYDSPYLQDYTTYPAYTLPELLAFFSVGDGGPVLFGLVSLDDLHPAPLCDRLIEALEEGTIDRQSHRLDLNR